MFRKLSEKPSRMISFRVSNLLGTIGVQFREIGNDIKVNKYKHSFDYKVVCTMHYALCSMGLQFKNILCYLLKH